MCTTRSSTTSMLLRTTSMFPNMLSHLDCLKSPLAMGTRTVSPTSATTPMSTPPRKTLVLSRSMLPLPRLRRLDPLQVKLVLLPPRRVLPELARPPRIRQQRLSPTTAHAPSVLVLSESLPGSLLWHCKPCLCIAAELANSHRLLYYVFVLLLAFVVLDSDAENCCPIHSLYHPYRPTYIFTSSHTYIPVHTLTRPSLYHCCVFLLGL